MESSALRLEVRLLRLPAALLIGAAGLRAVLQYGPSTPLLSLLIAWTALYLVEAAHHYPRPAAVHLYLAVQSALALLLMAITGQPPADYFGNLFVVLSMQAMQRLSGRQGAAWIGLFSLLLAAPLLSGYGLSEGLAFLLVYAAGCAFMGAYALATRRAQEARSANQDLAHRLEQTNQELEGYAKRLEQLAAARERHHLARELHDSVTQTVFSLNLASQSALLLLEREPGRVPEQLDHIGRLAQTSLAQMQQLIAELRPAESPDDGLLSRLQRHLQERYLPQELIVDVTAVGQVELTPEEEQGLYAIAREALNNVVKHARATQAEIHLQLDDPPWMEVTDNGRGFECPPHATGVGLPGMRERALEIGWGLNVRSGPGKGTCVRIARQAEGVLQS